MVGLLRKDLREPLCDFLLPLAHLNRMDLVFCGYGVDRLEALEGLKTNTGFQIGTVLTAFLGHVDRFSGLDLTIRPVQFPGTTSLEPGRCIATLGSYSSFGGREAWQRTLIEVLRRWTSRPPADQAGLGRKWAPGDPEHHEQVLAAAGFAEVATYSFLEDHAWSLEAIMGFLDSTSVASKAALAGNGERFASELRAALLSHDPGGVYRERIEWGYTLGRKPT